jgi:hypothetical protein
VCKKTRQAAYRCVTPCRSFFIEKLIIAYLTDKLPNFVEIKVSITCLNDPTLAVTSSQYSSSQTHVFMY